MQVYYLYNHIVLFYTYRYKLLGKTSILERIKSTHGLASLKPEQIPPTVGMNLARLNIKGNTVIFWDLGGQIKMRSKLINDYILLIFLLNFSNNIIRCVGEIL